MAGAEATSPDHTNPSRAPSLLEHYMLPPQGPFVLLLSTAAAFLSAVTGMVARRVWLRIRTLAFGFQLLLAQEIWQINDFSL